MVKMMEGSLLRSLLNFFIANFRRDPISIASVPGVPKATNLRTTGTCYGGLDLIFFKPIDVWIVPDLATLAALCGYYPDMI